MARFWCVLLCALISAIIAFLVVVQTGKKRAALSLSTLKVLVGEGHGSAVHIGNRYIITAAHVVGSEAELKLKGQDGSEYVADVLWSNPQYDVALLRARDLDGVAVSRLNCEGEPSAGDALRAVGNPGPLEFVQSWGHVSGPSDEYFRWKVAFVADLGIAPGSSGGPVLDHSGRVVGIVVGVSLTSIGMFPSPTNFAIIVPAKGAICQLLARHE